MREFYELLGVDTNATTDEIKRAYRQKAKQYHPDLNPGDEAKEQKFKELTRAYEVLSNDEQRRLYDMYGEDGIDGNFGYGQTVDFNDIFGDLFDIFGGFGGFGQNQSRPDPNRPRRGSDIRTQVKLTFKEAVLGTEKEINIRREEVCSKCHGKRTLNPDSIKTCQTCHGTGQVTQVRQSVLGQMVQTSVCPTCEGSGEIIEEPCDLCHGTGREMVNRKIKLTIPKGVNNGNVMNLSGEGNQGYNDGPNGNLQVVFLVEEDEFFKRKGDDLHIEIPITYSQAVLGDKIKIPTINDIIEKEIPKGTESGTVIKIRGKGVPRVNRPGHGDLYVQLKIIVPKKVSKKEEELLKDLLKLQGKEIEKSQNGLLGKIKDLFE